MLVLHMLLNVINDSGSVANNLGFALVEELGEELTDFCTRLIWTKFILIIRSS